MASGGKLVILAALGGNVAIAVTKYAAALIAGSSSMLTEAIHSTVDCGDQVLMLYGRHRARRPPDRMHPLGHGRELYFWSFVVALLIFAGGAGVSIYEGIGHIRRPEMLSQPLINYGVLAVSFVFESVSISFAIREFRRRMAPDEGWIAAIEESKDPTIFLVLMEDGAALLGLTVAAAFIGLTLLTGNPLWDGIGSIVIGAILAAVAAILAYQCKQLLIGERARPELQDKVRAIAERQHGVCTVNDVITVHLSPEEIVTAMSIDLDDNLPLSEVERIIETITDEVKGALPQVSRMFIHPQPRQEAREEREALEAQAEHE